MFRHQKTLDLADDNQDQHFNAPTQSKYDGLLALSLATGGRNSDQNDQGNWCTELVSGPRRLIEVEDLRPALSGLRSYFGCRVAQLDVEIGLNLT